MDTLANSATPLLKEQQGASKTCSKGLLTSVQKAISKFKAKLSCF
jgi:hypothetical protein